MARGGVVVDISGPLFDRGATKRARKAMQSGITELTEAARDIAKDKAPRRTGDYVSSITAYVSKGDDPKLFGIARSSNYGRPYRSGRGAWAGTGVRSYFLERGYYRGVKVRRGRGIFGPAYRAINAVNKDGYLQRKIVEVLN